jgi:hypothetical protein
MPDLLQSTLDERERLATTGLDVLARRVDRGQHARKGLLISRAMPVVSRPIAASRRPTISRSRRRLSSSLQHAFEAGAELADLVPTPIDAARRFRGGQRGACHRR